MSKSWKNLFNFDEISSSWQPIVKSSLEAMDQDYLQQLQQSQQWLPGAAQIFNAFKQPLDTTRYILMGESPYPRPASANGYAFWDAAVDRIWDEKGMSKTVNRATSLRNIMKMLLLANGSLSRHDLSQSAIAALDKRHWITTLEQLFDNFHLAGFLLLNASLVLSDLKPRKESLYWQPFIRELLLQTLAKKPSIQLILLGKIAETILKLLPIKQNNLLIAEHPYNLSFIHNAQIQDFFKPFNLLEKHDKLASS